MARFDVIGFDADDTLWHNERLFATAQESFQALLAQYHSPDWIAARLYEAEVRNLPHFGYGVKAFALSMVETAVELTEGRISGRDIQAVVDIAKEMLAAEVELLDHAAETVSRLAGTYRLLLITKGDLRDQERKVRKSGLEPHFAEVEIISEKDTSIYRRLLARHGIAPEEFVMVGNSLKSDILPVLDLGGSGVYVPYRTTWEAERADPPSEAAAGGRFFTIPNLHALPPLLEKIQRE